MVCGHGSGGLGGKLVKLAGGDALVDACTHLLRHEHGVAVLDAETITQLLQTRRDLIEVHRFLPTVSLDDIHLAFLLKLCKKRMIKRSKLGFLVEEFHRTSV